MRNFELVARNYGEVALSASVTIEPPSGWVIQPSSCSLELGSKEEKTLLFSALVGGEATPGNYEIKVTSDFAGTRSLIATIFSKLQPMSLAASDWLPWPGVPALARQEDKALVISNAPGKPYSAVELPFEVDFSSKAQLLLEASRLKGAWAVKIRAEEGMEDWVVIKDTNRAGTQVVPLNVPGWEGVRKARLLVFSLGEGGEVVLSRAALVWE